MTGRHTGAAPIAVCAIERLTTAGVCGLAAGSFAMSYEALHALALAQGVPVALAWLWPLVVDGFILVASLSVVHAAARQEPAIYPWVLVASFSSLSVLFNILQAQPTPLARLVAAVPPLALVMSFELLTKQVRTRQERVLRRPAERQRHGVADQQQRVTKSSITHVHPRRPHAPSSTPDRARELIERWTTEGKTITGRTLAGQLGVSEGYGRRLLREIGANQQGDNSP